MPLSETTTAALKMLDETLVGLGNIEETILQASSTILQDKSIAPLSRIQISNSLVTSSANARNAITQINTALQQAHQLG